MTERQPTRFESSTDPQSNRELPLQRPELPTKRPTSSSPSLEELRQKLTELDFVLTETASLGDGFADVSEVMKQKKTELQKQFLDLVLAETKSLGASFEDVSEVLEKKRKSLSDQPTVEPTVEQIAPPPAESPKTPPQESLFPNTEEAFVESSPERKTFLIPDTERSLRGYIAQIAEMMYDGQERTAEEIAVKIYGYADRITITRAYAHLSILGKKILPETPYMLRVIRQDNSPKKTYLMMRGEVAANEMIFEVQEHEPIKLRSETLRGEHALLYELLTRDEGVTAEEASFRLYGSVDKHRFLTMHRLLRFGRRAVAQNPELELMSPGKIKSGTQWAPRRKGEHGVYRLQKKSAQRTDASKAEVPELSLQDSLPDGEATVESEHQLPFVGSFTKRDIEYLAILLVSRRTTLEQAIAEITKKAYSLDQFNFPQDDVLYGIIDKWNTDGSVLTEEEHTRWRASLADKLVVHGEDIEFIEELFALGDNPKENDVAQLMMSLLNMRDVLYGEGTPEEQKQKVFELLKQMPNRTFQTDKYGWVQVYEKDEVPVIRESSNEISPPQTVSAESQVSVALEQADIPFVQPESDQDLSEEELEAWVAVELAKEAASQPPVQQVSEELPKKQVEKSKAIKEAEQALASFVRDAQERIEACELPYAKAVVKEAGRKITLNQWGMISKHTSIGMVTGRVWENIREKFSISGGEFKGAHTVLDLSSFLTLLAYDKLSKQGALKGITPKELERTVAALVHESQSKNGSAAGH